MPASTADDMHLNAIGGRHGLWTRSAFMAVGCPAADHYPACAVYESLGRCQSKVIRALGATSNLPFARGSRKALGKETRTVDGIAAAVSKVENNPNSMMNELRRKSALG
jgi:hypothetical protein